MKRLPNMLRENATPLLMLGVALGAGVAVRYIPGLQDMLHDTLIFQKGAQGRLIYLGLASGLCAVGFPRQLVCLAAGLAYGFGFGVFLASLATLAGCSLAFLWARWFGQMWKARRSSAQAGRIARLHKLVLTYPFSTILTLRLMPVGSSLVLNMACGLCGVAFAPFFLATLLGSLPQTVVFVLLGEGICADGWSKMAVGALFFVASTLLGVGLLLRWRRTCDIQP